MKKVAVILSGCGVYDGSEIYESVLTLLRLEQQGAKYQCMAPDVPQLHVIDHQSGEPVLGESRNVLQESARLARGRIVDISTASPADYDALILPGGFGAAKNLSDFALRGDECTVNEDVAAFARAIHAAGKPVGLICIAPAMIPQLLGKGIRCTIGNDAEVAGAIERMGGVHQECGVDAIVEDAEAKVVTTPAYMVAGSMLEAQAGISKLVDRVLELA
ncbi:MAG: isoprenoid biosynthesis glyoxalase ElbB [Oceanospirillaceae bacterium]|nr:isoprenoid biosynthesis glyoxalase ElbB [Oceanospirillaceae bacterium]